MHVVHATFPIEPESQEDAVELSRTLAEHSRAEAGVIDYRGTADLEDPNRLRFFERYPDEAAFVAHAETEHFQECEAALSGLLAGEPEVTRFDGAEASAVEL